MSDRRDAIAAAIVISILALIWLVLHLWWQAALLLATATAIAVYARRTPVPTGEPDGTPPADPSPLPAPVPSRTVRRKKRR